MIFHENGRRFSRNIIPYFCQKLGKMSQNLSSAAVVIGALRVNLKMLFAAIFLWHFYRRAIVMQNNLET